MKQVDTDYGYVKLLPECDEDLLKIGRILEQTNKYSVHKSGKRVTHVEVPKGVVDKK